ncbi:hypothetical protein C491_07098 [Natronococcus amylolyticus DSM 10524]|uniref:Uncharacterized protein n=1 Tax=Natronococcus amylolyticus DSM 10524 TaxID=1227497 RepID=L9XCU7_9EURY|nr:hypothetical protein [Natronococcus amylolyticus]ELY59555.1 hypothetical protein C491_07098 [Natronococcus amylolyticus DSM 10524]
MTLSRRLRSRRGIVLGAIAAVGAGFSTYLGTAASDDETTAETPIERDGTDEGEIDQSAAERDEGRDLPPAQHERLCRCPSCMGGLGAPGE